PPFQIKDSAPARQCQDNACTAHSGCLCFANIRSARNRLTRKGHGRKDWRHASAFAVRLSIRSIASYWSSGRGHRKRGAPNANRRLSAKAKAAAADDLGPDVLDYPPESVGRLAHAVAL